MDKKKTLLIVEQAGSDLKQSVSNNSNCVYLEGVFTEFKIRNRNGRIYEASDFIPKMNELTSKINKHTLLGELDHPVNFDISLKNVSHVVEKLEYDSKNDRVIGKIRLLNTEAGKQAQALVRDGIPLHISSRAAGQINPQTGKVTLEKLFTYDLVADPGFENAELKRVNEAYGFSDLDNVYIYECEMPDENEKENENITNIMNTVNEQQNVNIIDFQKYTEYIAGVIEGVKHSVDDLKTKISVNESNTNISDSVNNFSEKIQKISETNRKLLKQVNENTQKIANLVDYSNYMSENLNNSIEYSNYLGENLNDNFKHNDYLAEQLQKASDKNDKILEKVKSTEQYANYLGEQLQKNCNHNDYLAEKLEINGKYANYLGEQLQKNCNHNDYLAEQLQTNSNHNDYLAEQLQTNSNHNDYLAEQLQTNCKHNDYLAEEIEKRDEYANYLAEKLDVNFKHNDYLAENMNNNIKYNEYLAEQLQLVADQGNSINENKTTDGAKNMITEKFNSNTKRTNNNTAYMSAITEKLDAILNAQSETIKKDNFVNFLSEGRKNEFNKLNDDTKQLITEAMNKAQVKNEAQTNMVWKSVYESKKGLDLVENMPKLYVEKWNSLSDKRKTEILNEAKFYNIKSTNDIEYFWSTRDFRNDTIVVERVNTDSAKTWAYDKNEQNDYISSILNRTKKGMRNW